MCNTPYYIEPPILLPKTSVYSRHQGLNDKTSTDWNEIKEVDIYFYYQYRNSTVSLLSYIHECRHIWIILVLI